MDKEIERIEAKEAEAVDQEPQMSVKDKKPRGKAVKAVLLTLLVIVLMGASAGAAYMYRDNSAKDTEKEQSDKIESLKTDNKKLEKELATFKDSESDDDSIGCPAIAPNASALDNIKASITSANTAVLEGYMATSVNVILAASEAYGPQTPAQAIADISSFLGDDNAAWDYDFSLPAATIDSYQNGDYDEYFTDISVIGKNGQNKVISFSFNCEAKIGTVFMSSSEGIL